MGQSYSLSVECEEEATQTTEEPVAAVAETEAIDTPVEEEEAVEEEDALPEITIKTAPYDPRFPATNQARHCYTRYNEFHKCAAEKGEDEEDCKFFQKAYRSLCPNEWVAKWNEEREEGTFAGRY